MKALLPLLLLPVFCFANDGAFRVNGNQLIPMYETDISVRKEILAIKRIADRQAQITVYYEFFNPKDDKTIEVGFEAYSPAGDVDATPRADGQPYIDRFTVNLNGANVPWKVALVRDKSYYREGKIKAITLAQATKEVEDASFFYVYHFKALFRKGLNILTHTYTVDLSSSVVEHYSLLYVLTAAKRWANRQIDDFTLQIEMGDIQELVIPRSFFSHAAEWTMTGSGKSFDRPYSREEYDSVDKADFFVRSGGLVFKKTNFRPDGELSIVCPSQYTYYSKTLGKHTGDGEVKFDSRVDSLSFSVEDVYVGQASDELSKKILHNLPFARRGYIFKSREIQAYYSRQPWYMPDPGYVPDESKLTQDERTLLKR